jgi:hypothetical protein
MSESGTVEVTTIDGTPMPCVPYMPRLVAFAPATYDCTESTAALPRAPSEK